MPATYPTFEQAQRRVEVLKQSGIWPGIRCRRDGSYSLTFDPEQQPGGEPGHAGSGRG